MTIELSVMASQNETSLKRNQSVLFRPAKEIVICKVKLPLIIVEERSSVTLLTRLSSAERLSRPVRTNGMACLLLLARIMFGSPMFSLG